MVRLILLGPPGAGKGTQAQKLAAELKVPHISTGVILREAAERGTELGKQAKAIMDAGHLVSDHIMLGIIQDRLQAKDCEKGFILDGFPRTIPQAEALDQLLSQKAEPPVVIANLDLDEEELRRRIAGRRGEVTRSDDAEETVLSRFQVYQEKTRPLLDYYGDRVRPIDGKGSVPEVFQRLTDLLQVAAGRSPGVAS
ncbi:MAG: adenylate kinase [Vicinamibacteria bacterium]